MDDEHVETGLVAAAVTPQPPAPEPEPTPAAVPAVIETKAQMPDGWDLPKVAALVTDVAQNMYDKPYLLKKHKLTAEQYAILEGNEFFKRALEAETLTWQGINSIQKRLALEAAIAVEAGMPTVAARLSKSTEPLADVVALLKVLSEIAGVIGSKAAAPGVTGEKFKIVINMGSETVEREASGSAIEVQSLTEGSGNPKALRALVGQTGNEPALATQPQGS